MHEEEKMEEDDLVEIRDELKMIVELVTLGLFIALVVTVCAIMS